MKNWTKLPLVSAALVIVNVVVFIACKLTGERLYELGELAPRAVLVGREYGRILWALFLHADEAHLFNNMIILFFLGAMIEQEIGHLRYAVLYFASGIAGNLFSLLIKLMTANRIASIGASGAVFGLDGVLLALVLFSGRKMQNVTPTRVILMIVLSLYTGFTMWNVDNAAHVGGLITGFFLGMLMCVVDRWRLNKKGGGEGFEY